MRAPLGGKGALLGDAGVSMATPLGGRPRRARIDLRRLNFPASSAEADLDCLGQQSLRYGLGLRRAQDEIVSSGATGRTYFNWIGVNTSGGAPRFNYHQVTCAPLGLQVEPQATQLITRSAELNDAAWTKGNITISSNTAVAPDGSTAMDRMVEDAVAGARFSVRQNPASTVSATHTLSGFFRQGVGTRQAVLFFGAGTAPAGLISTNRGHVRWDLATAALAGSDTQGLGSISANSITAYQNATYRCVMTFVPDSGGTSASLGVGPTLSDGTNVALTRTGDGVSGVDNWGCQLEATAYATSQIPSAASQVTVTADSNTTDAGYWQPDGGTVRLEFEPAALPGSEVYWGLSAAGSSSNSLYLWNNGGNLTLTSVVGGSGTSANLGVLAANTRYVVAISFEAGAIAARVNGGAEVSLVAQLPSGIASEGLMRAPWGNSNHCCGHFRRRTYWRRPLRARLKELAVTL